MSIIRYRKLWFAISVALCAASILAIAVWGLPPGIDFVGGSVLELRGADSEALRQAMAEIGESAVTVQPTGDGSTLVRLRELSTADHERILGELKQKFPRLEERQFISVGPTISRELLQKSILAIVLSISGILVYLAVVFRKATSLVSPWTFGVIAIIALLHDILVASGFFAIYAHFWSGSADSLFITALLTTLGFSVHDTIVIFNRVKTNLRVVRLPFAELVDRSLMETLTRSLNTSMTTALVLFALLLFGSASIRPFLLTLLAGIVVGAYSSICLAGPLLVLWQERRGRSR